MTDVFIYPFDDYKAYLEAYVAALPRQGYGFKSRMAEALGCQTSYIAQVLAGGAHFSLEQGEDLNSLLKHKADEAEFFLLLIQCARAGSERLRRRVQSQMEVIRERQLDLKERFAVRTELDEPTLIQFFSRWSYAIVHLALSLPHLRTREALAQALSMEPLLIEESLRFLVEKGLAQEGAAGHLSPGPTRIFIGRDSPILNLHHTNWRYQAVRSLDRNDPKDLHFTSLYSLSKKDAAVIRERLIREIESVRTVVKESPEEELHLFALDFFRLDAGSTL